MQVTIQEPVYAPAPQYAQTPPNHQYGQPPSTYQHPVGYGYPGPQYRTSAAANPHTPYHPTLPRSTRVERPNQLRYVESRFEEGIQPLALAGVASLLTQMDAHASSPSTPITISVGHGPRAAAVTLLNNEWTGCDLTYPFTDERSANVVGPCTGVRLEQDRNLYLVRPSQPTTMRQPQLEPLPSSSRTPAMATTSPMQQQRSPAPGLLAPSSFAGGRESDTGTTPQQNTKPGETKPKRPIDLRDYIAWRQSNEEAQRRSSLPAEQLATEVHPEEQKNWDEYQRKTAQEDRERALEEEQQKREQAERELEELRQQYEESCDASLEGTKQELEAKKAALAQQQPQQTSSSKTASASKATYVPSKVVFTPTPGSGPIERLGPRDRPIAHPVRSKTPQQKRTRPQSPHKDARETLNQMREQNKSPEGSGSTSGYAPPKQRTRQLNSPKKRNFKTPLSIVARDVERLEGEFDASSPNYRQFRRASEKTPAPDRKEIMKGKIHGRFTSVLNYRMTPPASTPVLLEAIREAMEVGNSSYLQPIPDVVEMLTKNCPGRFHYTTESEEAVECDPAYGRRLESLLPIAKPEMQSARVLLVMDSTVRANLQYGCLLPDVALVTLPLATLENVWELMHAIFTPRSIVNEDAKGNEVRCPKVVVVGNLLDHLAITDRLRNVQTPEGDDAYRAVIEETVSYVTQARSLRDKVMSDHPEVRLFFTAPPGQESWPVNVRMLVLTIIKALKAYDITMLLPAPAMKVCQSTLRPADLTVPAFFAGLSKLLMGHMPGKNLQLTTDDATAWDFGTSMADKIYSASRKNPETFMAIGQMTHPEAMKMLDNFWFERRAKPGREDSTKTEGDLLEEAGAAAEVMERISYDRLRTRTLPNMVLAKDSDQLDENLAVPIIYLYLREELGANEGETYASWRQKIDITLEEFAEDNGGDLLPFLHLLAVTWTPEVVAIELRLDEAGTKAYIEAMRNVTLIELLAYYIVAGRDTVKRGPASFLELFWGEKEDLRGLFSYLVHTRNSRTWLYAMCAVFDPQNNLKMRRALEERIHAILAWVYSTLVNVSGIMNPALEENHPPMSPRRMPKHMRGFFFPRQMATLMQGEVEDLMPLLAPALFPIFGFMTALRYPTQPLRLVSVGNNSCSIVSFLKTCQVDTLAEKIAAAPGSFSPPMAYTMMKMLSDLAENLLMLKRARNRSTGPLPTEIHPINWRQDALYPCLTGERTSSRAAVESMTKSCMDRLGKKRGEYDLGHLMLDDQHVDERSIAHPRAVPREFDWEALCDLMLFRCVEQVQAVNWSVATETAKLLQVTNVEVAERQPCVDYAVKSVKITNGKMRVDKKPFFAGVGIPEGLEQRNEDLHRTYVNMAKYVNKVGRADWLPPAALNLLKERSPPPPPPVPSSTAPQPSSHPFEAESARLAQLAPEQETPLASGAQGVTSVESVELAARRVASEDPHPEQETMETQEGAASIPRDATDAAPDDDPPPAVRATAQALTAPGNETPNSESIERELLNFDFESEDMANASGLPGDLLVEEIEPGQPTTEEGE